MLELKLDTKNSTAELKVALKGEAEPLHIYVQGVTLTAEDGKGYVSCGEVTTSREWINTLVKQLYDGKPVEVPEDVVRLLGVIGE